MSGLIPKAPKPKNTLASRLRRVRTSVAGLNQHYFAELLGVSFGSYRLYERGERNLPITAAMRVCEIYKLDANWFLLGKGEND